MIEKLIDIEKKYLELQKKISDEKIINQREEFTKLTKELSDIEIIITEYRTYKKLNQQLSETKELLDENDKELRELALIDLKSIEEKIIKTSTKLKKLLIPKDPLDKKNILIEIRAGTGGEEAALFAADLFRMYIKYSEQQKWKVILYNSNPTGKGGYKEIIFKVSGKNVYSKLKYEGGVHRVQRVPETESQGRLHTSAVTVAVLPEMDDIEVDIDSKDLKIDTFRASGCGGQHVNTTDSAVRITHVPTGLVASCQDEKSQLKNKNKAMAILRARVYKKMYEEEINKRTEKRRIMVGSGDRSEKIRTYNFPQNRVTDHRINLTLYKLDEILNGDIDHTIESLATADEIEKLKNLE